MRLLTIGFTQKTAERFFTLLRDHGVQRVIDIRLRPDGQLAGFAKQQDLAYFLQQLADCDYMHMPILAPTDEIMSAFRADHDWQKYVEGFGALLDERGIPQALDRALFSKKTSCLLCSEATATQCHRRLVAERLAKHWPDVSITHI
jgi:uncharacterized protein (DUF488 family)